MTDGRRLADSIVSGVTLLTIVFLLQCVLGNVFAVDLDGLGLDVVASLAQVCDTGGQTETASLLQGIHGCDRPIPEHVKDLGCLAHAGTPMGLSLSLVSSWAWRHGGCQPWRIQVLVMSVAAAGV
jgi:hypothetical protein